VSPKAFLHELGIKPIRRGHFSAHSQKILDSAYPLQNACDYDAGSMSVEAMNALFTDERIAAETLGSNFDRLANSMERVSKSVVFAKGKLHRVCDLGGGSGIVGMWLAKRQLCDHCEVFDHADKPLAIGRAWAARLGLKNVEFRHINYTEVAKIGSSDFDFVFGEHALELAHMPRDFGVADEPGSESTEAPLGRYVEFAKAIRVLLRPGGVGLIGGGAPTPTSVASLCRALREQQLTIDWRLSSNTDGFLLYVRPDGQIVLASTNDEALAILADSVPPRKVPLPEARSLEVIFGVGTRLVDIRSEDEGVRYRCWIGQRAGLACVFQRSSKGHEAATLFSAAKLHQWATDVLRDAAKRTITSKFVNERLEPTLNS
jgi:hypothetical protein